MTQIISAHVFTSISSVKNRAALWENLTHFSAVFSGQNIHPCVFLQPNRKQTKTIICTPWWLKANWRSNISASSTWVPTPPVHRYIQRGAQRVLLSLTRFYVHAYVCAAQLQQSQGSQYQRLDPTHLKWAVLQKGLLYVYNSPQEFHWSEFHIKMQVTIWK